MPRRLILAVAPLVLLALALAACTEPTRLPPAEPAATVEPLFASDEEALAAATAAYEEYLAVVDSALQDPLSTPSNFEEVATGFALEEALNSVSAFASRGLRFQGGRELIDVGLQQMYGLGESTEVVIYVCESVAGVDVLDIDDRSVVEPSRPDLTAFEVALSVMEGRLMVAERVLWTDQQFCLA